MTRQTFMLIVIVYGFILGFVMFLLPEFAVSSYAGNPANVHETSTMRFFGALQIGFNFVALAIRNSSDTKVIRTYLLSSAGILLGSLGIGLYYVLTKQVPFLPSNWLDVIIWISLGLGSLYFWNKETEIDKRQLKFH